MSAHQDVTTDNITRKSNTHFSFASKLVGLGAPIAVGIMIQTAYHVINAFWVGRLGADALAVISLAFPVNLLVISLASGLALGGTILIARRHGEGNREQVDLLAAQTLSGMSILALIITAIGVAISPIIPTLLSASGSIHQPAVTFLQITFAGTLFTFLSMAFQYNLRALGHAQAPLLIIFPSVLINALLDPLLIFGWGPIPAFGVQGAALATLLTQLLTTLAGIWLMYLPRFGLSVQTQQLIPNTNILKTLLKLGIPASIEQSVGALSVSVMTVLASGFGTMALASYGIAFRLMTFTMIPAIGISMATSILLSNSLGHAEKDAANTIAKEASVINFLMMSAIATILFFIAPNIAAFFSPTDPSLAAYCSTVLQFFALSYPFSSIQTAMAGAFRGAGDTFMAMMLSVIGVWVLQIPLAIILAIHTSLEDMGLWWSILISAGLNAIIAIGYFQTQRWKKT